ncbi:MAG: hypothetical protein NC307_06720 [Roseburia sp.]|nr:hypothetical protein [Roseburia sp.]
MKHIIYGLVCTLTIVFTVVIALTLQGRTLRSTEIEQALAESVDGALSNLMENNVYPVDSEDLFAADLLQALLAQTNSTSDITVSVLEADFVHGILSVEITEKYRHPNGKKGTVSACRTVIFDRDVEEEEENFEVSFFTGDEELFKRYTVPGDGYCNMPAEPKIEGKTFKNWRFVTGGTGVAREQQIVSEDTGVLRHVLASGENPVCVTGDISLVAVFQ